MNDFCSMLFGTKSRAISVTIYRLLVVIGVLWLGQNFVRKEDYTADKTRQAEFNQRISDAVLLWKEQYKVDSIQDKIANDHESRLRDLERSRYKQ